MMITHCCHIPQTPELPSLPYSQLETRELKNKIQQDVEKQKVIIDILFGYI